MNILIVDDNQGMVRTTALILEHHGYNVSTAISGEQAIDTVKQQEFDFILMDIKMPVMNGVEAFRRIKDIQPTVVVVMMTAYAVEDLIREAIDEGAYGVLYKPLDIEYMISLIETSQREKSDALILVVDDDPDFCDLIKDILEKHQYEIKTAHSGEEAIDLAHENAYDVILIDVKLPTINGLETYLAIRGIDPQVVVIMMTGFRLEMQELIDQALDENALTCLYKPFEMDNLLELLDEVKVRQNPDANPPIVV
jgi:DNA-binding NtrC family response regulator